jgi:hypothetical protein
MLQMATGDVMVVPVQHELVQHVTVHTSCVTHEHFQYLFKIRHENYEVHNRQSNYKKTNHRIVRGVYSECIKFFHCEIKASI